MTPRLIAAASAISIATCAVPAAALVDGAVTSGPRYAVALCEGDRSYDCVLSCTGTLVAPNLVVTSRHCADVVRTDILDCTTYRFGGALKPPSTIWVTMASPISNAASFHRGLRWDVPIGSGCGHDLALLALEEPFDASSEIASIAIQHDAIERLDGTSLDVYGYGRFDPATPSDNQRRTRSSKLLCAGGRDTCLAVPDGRSLLPAEFAMDSIACPGDSGGGVFGPGAELFGALSRSIGPNIPCGYGVYSRFDGHALLFARAAREASARGGYVAPSWVSEAERVGNSATLAPKSFGSPCDAASDCESGLCKTEDSGLTWSCVRACDDGCADGVCRALEGASFCFAGPNDPPSNGCRIAGPTTPAHPPWVAASTAVALALFGRLRRRG